VRGGLNPTRLRLVPDEGRTVVDALLARFPADADRLRALVAAGEVVDDLGRPVTAATLQVPGGVVYLYRDPPADEPRVPFEVEVLHEDDDLLVVDKPHFLATTPRGVNVVESALVRLRTRTGLDELSPAHRLDRATAGVLVLTKRAALRGAYQTLFQRREVTKVYEAVAPVRDGLLLPRTVRSRILKVPGTMAAQEVEGEPNAETWVELVGPVERDAQGRGASVLGRYRLVPRTGRTHQLRVHMASLGVPIINDDFFPVLRERARDDFSAPLQLLARSVRFRDPVTGREREFTSRRRLEGSRPPAVDG